MSENKDDLEIIPLTVTSNGNDPQFDFLPTPLPHPPFRMFICGSSGSGKTNMYLNLITRFLLKPNGDSIFSKIYVFSPSARIDKSFRIFEQNETFNDPEKTVIEDTLDTELIEEIINREQDDEQVLVVIDDFSGDKKALQDKVLYDLYFRSRHNLISVIFSGQHYFQFPIACRNNSNYICLFAMSKNSDISAVSRELATAEFNDEVFRKAVKMATSGKYSFLFIDRVGSHFYKNFSQEIVLSGGEQTHNE
jgi:Poxvirus A32 protein